MVILTLLTIVNAAISSLETFKTEAGTGRRQGQAVLKIDPDFATKSTIIDFNLQ